jgi:hypothetical protein
MDLQFLTPLGWLLAVGAVLPLAAFVIAELRERRVRRALRLEPPTKWRQAPLAASLFLLPVLLGAAAAQPVIESSHKREVRKDAEVYVVFDTSRSMLASSSPTTPDRFERARQEAEKVRSSLRDIPVGIASLTNRLLPHLFPTADESAFRTTADEAIGIERPPPDQTGNLNVTTFGPLAVLQPDNYFDAKATRRLAIVFTDGETTFAPPQGLAHELSRPPGVHVIFVHVAKPDERVFDKSGLPESEYRADPQSGQRLRALAELVHGQSFEEDQLDQVGAAARDALGSGGVRVASGTERSSVPLAPYVALAGFVPLALILRRRNL